MTQTEFNITTSDNLTLNGIEWKKDDYDPNAIVLIVHGLGEHKGRYSEVAKKMNQSNIQVIAYDQRGHGVSDGLRGHARSYDELINDLDQVISYTINKYPEIPLFLYGHSLGGSIVLYYDLINHNEKIKGLIITSPGLSPAKPVSPLLDIIGRILSKIWPTFLLNNELDINGISRDPNIIKSYKYDPLVHNKISARLGIELIDKGKFIITHTNDIKSQLLFAQGEKDRLVNPIINKSFYEALNTSKHFIWQPNGYHELHNDLCKDEILKNMIEWITQNSNS